MVGAKFTSISRALKGREEAGICTLTIEDIMDIHNKQKGRCYYSGILYTCKTKTNWQGSLERLDPSKGYTKDNVVISTLEFNGPTQWSLEKVKELYTLLCTEHEPNRADFDLIIRDKTCRTVFKTEIIDGVECVNCSGCKHIKPLTEFTKYFTINKSG